MIITMKSNASEKDLGRVVTTIKEFKSGIKPKSILGETVNVVAVIGKLGRDEKEDLGSKIRSLKGVDEVTPIGNPWTLAAKQSKNGRHVVVERDGVRAEIGGKAIYMMPGPCSVESLRMLMLVGKRLSDLGIKFIRGGAFKPRSAPGCFEGLGEKGLMYLKEVAEKYGLLVVTEFLNPLHAELFLEYVDVVQIGTKNGLNYELLKVAGQLNKPVLLKREWAARYNDWLNALEYVLREQEKGQVILCERGIRTFETRTRNTLDLNAIPVVKSLTWVPIGVDPSHGIGFNAEFVPPMTKASIAVGADVILIEVHPKPSDALTDGDQSLTFKEFEKLFLSGQKVANAIGRTLI